MFTFDGKMPSVRRQVFSLCVGLAILAVGIAGLVVASRKPAYANEPSGPVQNLLSDDGWSHVAGAKQDGGVVTVTGLGRAIVGLDGTNYQENPPVNLTGPHIKAGGDWQTVIKMGGNFAGASVRLYAEPPRVYDEWRYEPASLELRVGQREVQVLYRDGSGEKPKLQKPFRRFVSADGQGAGQPSGQEFIVRRHGDTIDIESNGEKITDLKAHAFVKSGTIWVGADAAAGTSWQLEGLSVQGLNKASVELVKNALPAQKPSKAGTLAAAASKVSSRTAIGAAVSLDALLGDEEYAALALGQFTALTTENALKPQFIHPQVDHYDFTEADFLVDTAEQNGLAVHGHTLVFAEANPRWLYDSKPADRKALMVAHITEVMKHYQGRIKTWDVVNEPLADDPEKGKLEANIRQSIWSEAMGKDYIATALRAARDADPTAKLYINEYGLEADGKKWELFLELVRQLKAANVPLDGVGFQSHIYEEGDEVNGAVLRKHIATLAGLGVQSRVSEIDVYGDNDKKQADQYVAVLKACLAQPTCSSYTTWGITDKYGSTTEIGDYSLQYGNDLLWSSSYKAKLAFEQLRKALLGSK